MLFSNINLRDELYRERDQQSRLMDQVEEVIVAPAVSAGGRDGADEDARPATAAFASSTAVK